MIRSGLDCVIHDTYKCQVILYTSCWFSICRKFHVMGTRNMEQTAFTYVLQYFLFFKYKQITNILQCNLFNTHILTLFLHISNITTLSFDNHVTEDGHCMPKHVGGVIYF